MLRQMCTNRVGPESAALGMRPTDGSAASPAHTSPACPRRPSQASSQVREHEKVEGDGGAQQCSHCDGLQKAVQSYAHAPKRSRPAVQLYVCPCATTLTALAVHDVPIHAGHGRTLGHLSTYVHAQAWVGSFRVGSGVRYIKLKVKALGV